MFAWLNGPGRNLKDPLPGSTNYLGAYDKAGNLTRLRDQAERNQGKNQEENDNDESEDSERKEEEEGLDEEGRADARSKRGPKIPKERVQDLRPYPLNNQFRSQAVLSEELREELYRQIVVRKLDVATVSAAFGVDMRRVAAVVRLKTIEKQWVTEVS